MDIYAVIIDDTDMISIELEVFTTYEKAVNHFNEVKSSYLEELSSYYETESSKDYFCMYNDGMYLLDHVTITIKKLTLE